MNPKTPSARATRRELLVDGRAIAYYSLPAAEAAGLGTLEHLPFSLRLVFENLLRQQGEGRADETDLAAFGRATLTGSDEEIGFRFARVLMPDSSGVPLLGDLAAMRDAIVRLGGDPARLQPAVQVDLVVDHSVMVDRHGSPDALQSNLAIELSRNAERYSFLRWSAQAFSGLRLIPPGQGILHQINLEHLCDLVRLSDDAPLPLAYPDSVLGMDSHTPTINALGVLGWGVGGLEGGAAALGESVAMLVPEVVGCRLTGRLRAGVSATDLVLTLTERLRAAGVVGKFVEFCGPGLDSLALADRATVANMAPEYGATVGFFPADAETIRFLTRTGRDPFSIALAEAWLRAQRLFREPHTPEPRFAQRIELDLQAVEPSTSGPSRPQDRQPLGATPQAFLKVFPDRRQSAGLVGERPLADGDVVLAAITSCTNTSNPASMLAAGLLARNACARGLRARPWVKTSLSPGSRVVADYLEASGLQASLNTLGFQLTGFGCMSCAGNSGPLPAPIAEAVDAGGLAVAAVLSGNRNFEGRIHPSVRANFLASPALVVAYAIAGSVLIDLETEPLGRDQAGREVFLRDLWPDAAELSRLVDSAPARALFIQRRQGLLEGPAGWNALEAPTGARFAWREGSHFIRRPPFFDAMEASPSALTDIRGARMLALFGDMLTTDHISPIGEIGAATPAGRYLASLGVAPADFVNYGARRLNHDVMVRGTFANVRLRNQMTPGIEGSSTLLQPDGEPMSIHEAALRYRERGVPLVVVAGTEYGAGSSRDWAAKGTRLLGVRAVIARSFERIHRSNLIGMGVLPLQFAPGISAESLSLSGREVFDIEGIEQGLVPRARLRCTIRRDGGSSETIELLARLDTSRDVDDYRHGGLLHRVVRERLGAAV